MNRPRGFTLWEVIVTLSLIATATLVAGHLFVSSMMTLERNRQDANDQASARHCDVVLRQDVWSAKRIEQVSANQVTLSFEPDSSAHWSVADNRISRTLFSSVQSWPVNGLHFAANAAGVSLVDADGKTLRTFILPMQAVGAAR